MAGVFISYRREDGAGWTGRLAERLKQKFGAESIFMEKHWEYRGSGVDNHLVVFGFKENRPATFHTLKR